MREAQYQAKLIREIRRRFPDCVILKNDSSYLQGVPDLIILNGDRWAMLEVKLSSRSGEQPNQKYYISVLNSMSYAAFIYPEIEEEVLDELQFALSNRR